MEINKVGKVLALLAKVLSYIAAALLGSAVSGCTLFKFSVPLNV